VVTRLRTYVFSFLNGAQRLKAKQRERFREIRRDGKGGKCTQKGFMAKPILLKSNPIIYSYLFLMHLDFPIESNSCQPVALVSDPRE